MTNKFDYVIQYYYKYYKISGPMIVIFYTTCLNLFSFKGSSLSMYVKWFKR